MNLEIDETAFISDSAEVIGNVKIGKNSSVWPNATVRSESKVIIGENTNIQDNCVIHSKGEEVTRIGNRVTLGHSAVVHAAEVKNECLVGMNSVVLNDAVIGKNSIIGASALIPPGKEIPPESVVFGIPGKVERKITSEEKKDIISKAEEYKNLAIQYKNRSDPG